MKIFQTYSGAAQHSFLGASCIPFDYTGNGGTEYDVFRHIAANIVQADEVWGVLSWKFEVKTHVGLAEFETAARRYLEGGADCVIINPMIAAEALFLNVWEQGAVCGHHGIDQVGLHLIRSGLMRREDLLMPRGVFALCNYFVANGRFWRRYFDYVETVIANLEQEAKADSVVGRIYSGPSHYAKNPRLTMRPFVVERLLSSFLNQSGLSVCSHQVELPIYKAKFGNLIGNTLHSLSREKSRYLESSSTDELNRWNEFRVRVLEGPALFPIMHLDDPDIDLVDVGREAA